MTDIRCVKCRKLLFKGCGTWSQIEVKCPKCGSLNVVRIEREGIYNGSLVVARHEYHMIHGQEQQRVVPIDMTATEIMEVYKQTIRYATEARK